MTTENRPRQVDEAMGSITAAQAENENVLSIYMLGMVDFESALALQRRLHYEISGNRARGAVILCEHPPLITIGRAGSRSHILCEADELRARQWQVRWLNRGGGCLLHVPGQLAVYPVLALDELGMALEEYLARLKTVVVRLLDDFGIGGTIRRPGVYVDCRPVAAAGLAVRDWVSYHGLWLNVHTALEPFRLVRWGGRDEAPMTSLEKERRGPVRPALVRQRFIEHFAAIFPFARTAYFSSHPCINGSLQRSAMIRC